MASQGVSVLVHDRTRGINDFLGSKELERKDFDTRS